jgi:hypothetical protein
MISGLVLREIHFLKGSARGIYLLALPLTAAFMASAGSGSDPSGIRIAWIMLSISSMTASISSLEADRGNDLLKEALTGRRAHIPVTIKILTALWGPLAFLILYPLVHAAWYGHSGLTPLHLKGFLWALISVAWASALISLKGRPVYILSAMTFLLLTFNLPLGLPGMTPVPADSLLVLSVLGLPILLVFPRASGYYLKEGFLGVEISSGTTDHGVGGGE